MLRTLANYPRDHWRGELSLAVTWWVNCVAVGLVVGFGWPYLALALDLLDPDSAAAFTALALLQGTAVGLVPLWQLVGLWRSAARQVRADGKPSRWTRGRLGQVAGVFFLLFVAGRGLTDAAEVVIGARVAYAIGPYGYHLTVLPGAREIELAGGVAFGATRDLARLLAANPRVRRIRLNSGGGALGEARRLRALIAARGLDTITTTGCSSACVSAYMGGRFRYLQRGAPMGVHLPRNWRSLGGSGISPAFVDELAYFRARGVPDWFLAAWIRSGREFWYPGEGLLLRSGVVNFLRGPPPAARAGGPSAAL